jgi:hypothetical protein
VFPSGHQTSPNRLACRFRSGRTYLRLSQRDLDLEFVVHERKDGFSARERQVGGLDVSADADARRRR